MPKVVVVGYKSEIARQFCARMRYDPNERMRYDPNDLVLIGRNASMRDFDGFKEWRETRWLFCCGRIDPKQFDEMTLPEVYGHVEDNLLVVMRGCEQAFKYDDEARVCVIGSSSAWRGSHNMLYAALKAGLHGYIEGRPLLPNQQLVAIAPGIVADAGMTMRRADRDRVLARMREHPRERFVAAREVAQLALNLLWGSLHVNNTVVDMSGGER